MFGETIVLAYDMKPGEKLRYKTEVFSEQSVQEDGQPAQGFSSKMDMTMVQEGKKVNPDGSMEVDVTIVDGTIEREGQTAQIPTVGQTITIVMKRSGEIVRTSVNFPFSQPAFPEKQLKVNDTWTGDSQMDIPLFDDEGNQTGTKKADLTYHYSLGGIEQSRGYEVAVINVKCPETRFDLTEDTAQTITASGVTHFSHKSGRLVKSQVSTTTEIKAPSAVVGTKIKVIVELQEASGGTAPLGTGFMGGVIGGGGMLGGGGLGGGVGGGFGGSGTLGGGDDEFLIT